MSGNGRPLTWHEIEACLPVPTLTVYTTDQHDPTLDPIAPGIDGGERTRAQFLASELGGRDL